MLSKALAVMVAYLHMEAFLVFLYLDDWLLNGRSFEVVLSSTQKAHTLFQLNAERKEIHAGTSTKSTVHRGVLDSLMAGACLPLNRLVTLSLLELTIQGSPQTTIKNCLQPPSHMATWTFVTNHVRLCLYCFQGWLKITYSLNRDILDRQVMVLLLIKNSLEWWRSNSSSVRASLSVA